METDPYFVTQDNGAGAPVHFATTYKQLDMVRVARAPKRLARRCRAGQGSHLAARGRGLRTAGRAPPPGQRPPLTAPLTLPRPAAPAQLHHLLNNGAAVNQRDEKGFTPLHRAAYLAHYDGYAEIYEYLLVGARRALFYSLMARPRAPRLTTHRPPPSTSPTARSRAAPTPRSAPRTTTRT